MQLDSLLTGVMLVLATAVGLVLGVVWQRRRPANQRAWPRRWRLNPRPLFSTDERLLFKELRSALPNHVVLAKLNLLRFCQAADQFEARLWYDRLQTIHVSFVVCTPSGSVVSAIDIESPGKGTSARSQRMKEAVLEACRIRYVRCRPGQWPHQALIGSWALGQHMPTSPGSISESLHDVGDEVARKLRQRRAERAARWAESSFAQDSFFAFDSRLEGPSIHSGPVPLQASNGQ